MNHNNKGLRNQGDVMVSRFVVVPAIPTETGSVRIGGRYYSSMAPCGFDIFDDKEKCRLGLSFPTRAEAEAECGKKMQCDSQLNFLNVTAARKTLNYETPAERFSQSVASTG